MVITRRVRPACAVLAAAALVLTGCSHTTGIGSARAARTTNPSPGRHRARQRANASPTGTPQPPWQAPAPNHQTGRLRRGSDPKALPGDLLIADKLNDRLLIVDPQGRIRWKFPRKGDLKPGQTFKIPDDAFFSADGRRIIATEEDDFVIRIIDVARHRIVYTYGKPGVHGDRPNRLWNPDDAVLLPDGRIVTADIKNQRVLVIGPHSHHPAKSWGNPSSGYHGPPHHYGAPNGAFPLGHGRFLVTEIRGDWVDAIDLHGHLFWSTHVPGVAYPSDSNKIAPNRFLSVDYSSPGQIVIFNRHGRTLWRFAPHGKNRLDHPSLALPLPNGDIVCNDDYNHRVIVVDPRTDKIVWQYGHTGIAGHKPGRLDNPDGLDLAPPHSLVDRTLGPP